MRSWAKNTLFIFCVLQVTKCKPTQLDNGLGNADQGARTLTVESMNALNDDSIELKSVTDNLDGSKSSEQAIDAPMNGEGVVTTEALLAPKDKNCGSAERTNCVCDCITGTIIRPLENDECANEVADNAKNTTSEPLEESTVEFANDNFDLTTETTPDVQPLDYNIGDTDEIAASDPPTSPELPTSCTSVGNFSHESDCHLYYACVPFGDALQNSLTFCPPNQAFNTELSRCTRDISPCDEGPRCEMAGTHPHPLSNNSYYLCVARLIGGFRQYHIQCATGKVFVAQLGKCFIDIDNLDKLTPNNDEVDDEDIVKMEIKQLKAADKARLKEQKLKEKIEKKLQKELAKIARKDAKNQAKVKNASYDDDD